MENPLPPEVAQGATLQGNEYGWRISSFPEAVARAEAEGYACLGGQFQFRLDDGSTCEMYWLNADSRERESHEAWSEYSRRSCTEILSAFRALVSNTDFAKEAENWPSCHIDPEKNVVFVAYFILEDDLAKLSVP